MDYHKLISPTARSIDASGIRRVFDLAAQLKDPINFSIGQPHFDVPQPIKRAAIAAIEAGRNGYTPTQGIPELNQKIRAELDARFKTPTLWNDYATMITSGVSGGLVLALMACAGPGDEVIIPDPYFVMYKQLAKFVGAKPVFADTYPDFKLTAARVEPLITPRTRMLFVSSPSNPTGVVSDLTTWKELVELCTQRNILIVSDEIYDVFCYEPVETPIGPRCPSPASLSDQILVLRGFSKTYGMTGWRLGYAAGPTPIIEQMKKLQQYSFVCAPSMVQHAGVAAMEVDMSREVADYRRKRDRVVERLSPHYELTVPGGAFYAFPRAPGGMTGAQFAELAISRNLLLIPGNVFSERDTHFRISYACQDDQLDRGLDILTQLARA